MKAGRLVVLVTTVLGAAVGQAQVNVLTQHNDGGRTGANIQETVLTPANVNAKQFGMLFKRAVDDQVYGQPLLVSGVKVSGGLHDVVYVTTVNNSVYAFDANAAEAETPLWHVNFGTPANLYDAQFGCLDMNGKMGIVGTPVVGLEAGKIGAARGVLYVVALTAVGDGFVHRLHALDLATGAEVAASPVEIKAKDFQSLYQNQRPALLLANGTVYVAFGSHCDLGPYHGFLMGYDAKTLKQMGVFNVTPTGQWGAIWQSGNGPAVDAQGNLYVVSGNGPAAADAASQSWDGKVNFTESFLKLNPKLKLVDWFTPTNHFELDKKDADLNTSGATLIPGTGTLVGGGKEGELYVLDMKHLGHLGDEHASSHFKATASHLHSLVFWEPEKRGGLLYVWGQRDKARVYGVQDGRLDPTPVMMRNEPNEGHPGAMLSLSANGKHDGILWAAIHATGDSWHESRPGVLHAYDAMDIQRELWNSLESGARDDCGEYSKMAPPTIANGKVYLASFGTQDIGTGQMCVYGLLPAGAAPAAPAKVSAMIHLGLVTLQWEAVAGARAYTVKSVNSSGATRTLAVGLVGTGLTGIPAEKGSVAYTVSAVNANGGSVGSEPMIAVAVQPAATERGHVGH